MIAILTIPGKAQAKQRARTFYNKAVGHISTWTPDATTNYETYVKMLYAQKGLPMFDCPVSLQVDIFMAVPVSESKKKRELKLLNQILPTKKPDIDNIVKSIKDALNKVAWKDDSYVVDLIAKKRYAENDSVTITIKEAS